jgi:hypothetical protein
MFKRTLWLLGMVTALLLLAGCPDEQKTTDQSSGYVSATEAYLTHFGKPPQGKEGRAYARVAYLPMSNDPGKIRALPVFLYDEADQVTKILRRLISDTLILPSDSELYKPFPNDLQVTVSPVEDGTQTLHLQTAQSWDRTAQELTVQAFAETALQFPETRRVRVTLNDKPLPDMPAEGYQHQPDMIDDVGLPQLVLMAGIWNGEESAPAELLIEFDRPIRLNTFSLTDADGNKVAGDYYLSIFQMAVVVHPQEPERYQAGTPLHAAWDVIDDLGRRSQGEKSMSLIRFTH